MTRLEGARVDLGQLEDELKRSRRSDRFRGFVAVVLLGAFAYMLGVVLPSIRTTTERTDCARAIADETNRLDRAADRAFGSIVVFAFRLPRGSPVTPPLALLVDEYEVANRKLEDRPPNQVLVEQTCPG